MIFGPKRLPGLGRQLGAGMREFKDSITKQGRRRGRRGRRGRRSVAARRPRRSADPMTSRPRSRSSDGVVRRAALGAGARRRRWPRTLRPIRHEDRLSLVEHLDELRTRLIICVDRVRRLLRRLPVAGRRDPRHHEPPARSRRRSRTRRARRIRFERTAAFQAQLRKSALASARAFDALALEAEDTVARGAVRAAGRAESRPGRARSPPEEARRPVTLGVGEPFTATVARRRLRGAAARAAAAALPGLRVRPAGVLAARSGRSRCR